MTRKRLLLCLFACSVLLAVGFFLLSIKTGPRINQSSFERIEEGMTEAEVVEILGGPPGDYGPGMEVMGITYGCIVYVPPRTERRWSLGDSAVTVWFNANGLVVEKEWEDDIFRLPRQQGVVEKMRNWCSSAFRRWL